MLAATWSKLPPRRPCFAIFRGVRLIDYRNQMESLTEPVQVCEVQNGRNVELGVKMTGRQRAFPIGDFAGEWWVLDLEANEWLGQEAQA